MTTTDIETEISENIPLQISGKKSSLCSCNDYLFEGPRCITTAFGVFSAVVTLALIVQIYYGDFQVIPHGSVATDSKECSELGTQILKQGGNAADSAIAAAFCLAVVSPHTCGLDAGGSILIYSHRTREPAVSIGFNDNGAYPHLPRLVLGLAELHKKFGKLPWSQLVQPSADIAKQGFRATRQLQYAIKKAKAEKLFPLAQAGKPITFDLLPSTLRTIAEIPEEGLYDQIDKTIIVNKTEKMTFRNFNVYVPYSEIGEQFFKDLKKVEELNLTRSDAGTVDYVYRLANITMDSYQKFNFTNKYYEGTSTNVAVMDLNDLYVSIVIGMSQPFGSQKISDEGYILDVKTNSLPTYLPIILVNADFICSKRIIVGANNLATAVQVVTALVVSDNSTVAVEYPRFNILDNGLFGFEDDGTAKFSDEVVDFLSNIGNITHMKEPYSSSNFVEKVADDLYSHSDSRGGGFASRF